MRLLVLVALVTLAGRATGVPFEVPDDNFRPTRWGMNRRELLQTLKSAVRFLQGDDDVRKTEPFSEPPPRFFEPEPLIPPTPTGGVDPPPHFFDSGAPIPPAPTNPDDWKTENHGIYYSFLDAYLRESTFMMKEAQYICHQRKMRLVSLNHIKKDVQLSNLMSIHGVQGVWTSGERHAFEFVWGHGQPTNFGFRKWSQRGSTGIGQPDNAGGNEHCLAVLNNAFGEGVSWHDVACHQKMAFACEPSGYQAPVKLPVPGRFLS